ncbi:leucyl aminopeptidase [Acetobacteraceae bacterium]|nr:leucyl aminopeptidase [Acetobacteraceae bacterium]
MVKTNKTVPVSFKLYDEALFSAQKPKALVVVCGSAFKDCPRFKALNEKTNGALLRAATAQKFAGKFGESLFFTAPAEAFSHIVISGIEKASEGESLPTYLAAEYAAGKAVKALVAAGGTEEGKVTFLSSKDLLPNVAFGAALAAYRYDNYITGKALEKKEKAAIKSIEAIAAGEQADLKAIEEKWFSLKGILDGTIYARDLVNAPSNALYPETYAKKIEELKEIGVEVELLDEAAMKKLGFGSLLGVAQGSSHKPYTVIMRYNGGAKGDAPVAFVGKGVTFDSGGISLKPAAKMDEMKSDMGGSGAVVGALKALALRKAKVNVVGVIGLVENMPSGDAQRPGDIVISYSGKTIEVLNTDAEGRLVLADVLTYTARQFKPKVMVDLATLTGAIVIALGDVYAGLFPACEKVSANLIKAADAAGEKIWRMPMGADYAKDLKSPFADLQNITGKRGAGSTTAAEFLKAFVEDVPWAHLDIAAVAWKDYPTAIGPKGATGFAVRLLNNFADDYAG